MERIGAYIIEETISVNGPSSVYLARHAKLGRKTFLKVYSGEDKTVIERFEREAKIVADLNSASIVQIYDFGEADGKFFISMEYVHGQNLAQFLKNGIPEKDQIIDIAHQIARAVAVLHKKGYIHRDLKPENILISESGRIRLTDFGITLHESLNRVTSTGALLGTPLYMSPEQINNLKLTSSSDVFALGIIFYQLATGIHPFDAPQYGQVFSNILTQKPGSVLQKNPGLPEWFSRLIEDTLEKDLTKRLSNAAEMVSVFGKNDVIDSHKHPLSVNPSSKGKTYGIVFILVLLIIAAGWYYFNTIEPVPPPSPVPASDSTRDSNSVVSPDTTISGTSKAIKTLQGKQSSNITNPIAAKEPSNAPTSFRVKTYPWCNVYLNYTLLDKTPMQKEVELTPGKYLLGLQNPGYPSYSDSIVIQPNRLNEVIINLDSVFTRLEIQVVPWGKIYIDGKYVGTSPLQHPLFITREAHWIEIKNNYYKTWNDSIDTSTKSSLQLAVVLKEK